MRTGIARVVIEIKEGSFKPPILPEEKIMEASYSPISQNL
jgi:hypothetical protein